MKTLVKICGLSTPASVDAAVQSNADFIGFVFYKRSPRFVTPAQAGVLITRVPDHIKTVALFVDASDDEISAVMATAKPDMLQLHGNENPARIQELKNRFGIPVMKAVRVAAPEDLLTLGPIQSAADWILFDAKVEETGALPGGNGIAFDWKLLKNLKVAKPWMLSGGLHPDNIAAALNELTPAAVDVSSGVEDAPGVKSAEKIHEFVEKVKAFS